MSMRTVTLKIPEPLLEELNEIVRRKRFASRSEAIRIAIIEFIKKVREKEPVRPKRVEVRI